MSPSLQSAPARVPDSKCHEHYGGKCLATPLVEQLLCLSHALKMCWISMRDVMLVQIRSHCVITGNGRQRIPSIHDTGVLYALD